MRLKSLEEKTKKDKESTTQDEVAGTYGTLNAFNSGVLMLENDGPGILPSLQNNGGIDMSGFGVPTTGSLTSQNVMSTQTGTQIRM